MTQVILNSYALDVNISWGQKKSPIFRGIEGGIHEQN